MFQSNPPCNAPWERKCLEPLIMTQLISNSSNVWLMSPAVPRKPRLRITLMAINAPSVTIRYSTKPRDALPCRVFASWSTIL
jgi:hypothetical protein